MICTNCKFEADVVVMGIYTHEEMAELARDDNPIGHAGCVANGCGCQHRNVGSVIIDRSNA